MPLVASLVYRMSLQTGRPPSSTPIEIDLLALRNALEAILLMPYNKSLDNRRSTKALLLRLTVLAKPNATRQSLCHESLWRINDYRARSSSLQISWPCCETPLEVRNPCDRLIFFANGKIMALGTQQTPLLAQVLCIVSNDEPRCVTCHGCGCSWYPRLLVSYFFICMQ
jgi:hypothetical protein